MMMDAKSIGIIGLGLLGGAIADRLVRANFDVTGYDINEDRRRELADLGGRAASSMAELADCPRVLLCLPDSSVVETVVGELLSHLRRGTVLIDTTTGDPDRMAALGKRLAECGIPYLDATVGGSSRQVGDGDVIVMIGGADEAMNACRDVFENFARAVFHVGPCGQGARMKLVTNLVLGLNRAVLAEGLMLAEALGLDTAEALAILQAGPAHSRVMGTKGEKMLTGDYRPQARLAQHLKDVRLILDAGRRHNAKLPLSQQHRELLEQLVQAGYGEADNSAVIEAFRRP
jgi:3-hydroxyisobutyrate dehydrogenase-like beta-hydroxyacid dehydrogenase